MRDATKPTPGLMRFLEAVADETDRLEGRLRELGVDEPRIARISKLYADRRAADAVADRRRRARERWWGHQTEERT